MPISSPMMNRMLGFLSCACAAVTMNATDRATAHCFSIFGVGFMVFCLSNPHPHSHRSPACSPSTPRAPIHRSIIVHLSGFEILLRNVICGAELLVRLILVRSTDIGLIMCRVRENVEGSPLSVDHCHVARRKLLELLLLRSRLGSDHLKAGRHKHALFVLRAACCDATGRQR